MHQSSQATTTETPGLHLDSNQHDSNQSDLNQLDPTQLDSNQSKLPHNIIIDEFYQIERVTLALKIVRDGIRDTETTSELEAWRDITDMMLEFHIQNLNEVMESLADGFEGIEYRPIVPSRYSLLPAGRNNYPAKNKAHTIATASSRKGGAHVAI